MNNTVVSKLLWVFEFNHGKIALLWFKVSLCILSSSGLYNFICWLSMDLFIQPLFIQNSQRRTTVLRHLE